MIKKYCLQVFWILMGQVFSAAGLVLMLQANLGADSWNVLHQGISNLTGMSFGMATVAVGSTCILIAVFMGESVGIGTLIGVFFTGPLIDLLLQLAWIPLQTQLLPGLLMLLVGLELLSFGTYLYMKQALGVGPRDAFNVALSRKFRLPVGIFRVIIEVVCTFVGWLLGGHVGIGTVLIALFFGLLLQLNFAIFRFHPIELKQESLLQTFRNITI